jgi:UPF0271 protein
MPRCPFVRTILPVNVDLNADVGEVEGGCDSGLMRSITSANIAAGVHAGSPLLLRRTVRLAREHGVAAGAHPGFPDREGFGRSEVKGPLPDIEDLVLSQVAAVAGVCAAEGVRLHHVKAHGALYNMATRNMELALAIARAVHAYDPALVVFGLPGSALLDAARSLGLRVAAEGFPDRAYRADGSLVPRGETGAVILDEETVVSRAVQLVTERTIACADGSRLSLDVETLCVHGDTPGADRLAASVRAGLEHAGVVVRSLP